MQFKQFKQFGQFGQFGQFEQFNQFKQSKHFKQFKQCFITTVKIVFYVETFPHHPGGKSHWRIVFLAATAAQEAHLSLRTYVRPYVRTQVVFSKIFCTLQ